jgi:hypothetical protein
MGRLTGPRTTAALAELAELAAGRRDLLARCAGLALGTHECDLDEDRYLRAAQLWSRQAPTQVSSRTGSTSAEAGLSKLQPEIGRTDPGTTRTTAHRPRAASA